MTTPTEAGPPTGGPVAERKRFTVGLAVVTAVGFAWRLGYTLATKRHDHDLFDEGDAFYYSAVARNLAHGHWFVNPFGGAPAADHPPLTVLILAPASRLFDGSVLAQRLTMTVIGTLVIVAIGLLGRMVAGPRAGLAAAAIAAVNPNLWMNDAVIMSESISTLLIVGCLACGFALAREPSLRRAVIAGAVIGLTVLARAEIGLFLPLMIAPILLRAPGVPWRDRALRLAATTALVAVVIAPWSLWNQTRFTDTVLLSTNDGTTILGANCPRTFDSNVTGGWYLPCVLDVPVDGLDGSQAAAVQRRVGLDYLKGHARRLPVVLIAREGRTLGFWRPDQSAYINQGEGRPRWASWWGLYAFWALIPVSILGAVRLRRIGVTLVPIGAAVLTVVAVSALFYGIPRFRLPIDVVTCLLAGVVAAGVGRRPGMVPPGDEAPTVDGTAPA